MMTKQTWEFVRAEEYRILRRRGYLPCPACLGPCPSRSSLAFTWMSRGELFQIGPLVLYARRLGDRCFLSMK